MDISMWWEITDPNAECLNPDCARIVGDDAEPFCSQRCEDAFVEWARAMEDEYAHNLHWTEVAQ